MRRFLFVLAVLSLVAILVAAQSRKPAVSRSAKPMLAGVPAGVQSAMNSIAPERIRAEVKFLSSDLLEGRGTGQRGGDIAGEFLATRFALYGLKPAGDGGTYLQKVPLVGVQTQGNATKFAIVPRSGPPMDLKFPEDYVTMNETQTDTADVDADIVYVGYGIEAPEYGWNDYKDADVSGKVLLMLVNEPPSLEEKFFKGRALTYYGRWTYKYEQAARKGAVGVLLIHKTDMASYGWDVVRNSWSGEKSYLQGGDKPGLKAASWIQLEVARSALASAGKDVDQLMKAAQSRDFRPLPLPLRLKAHIVSKVRPITSYNVVARLPGSDPKLQGQAVMYTAHYDHLGVRANQPGDNIYNGALDNATGVAILLELARAYGIAQPKPKRSIIFAAVTAEEQGLRGSEYLGLHPPVPAARIMLDLNYDDIKPYGDPEEVEVVGAERSTFYPVVQRTAKEFRLKIMPDAAPEAGHYYRSDHFSLARVGVPSFSVNAGRKFRGKTAPWGDQMYDAYTEKDYHQPTDNYRDEFDFTSNAVLAKFGFVLGWRAANQPDAIGWQPGDEFERARGKSAQGTPE